MDILGEIKLVLAPRCLDRKLREERAEGGASGSGHGAASASAKGGGKGAGKLQ